MAAENFIFRKEWLSFMEPLSPEDKNMALNVIINYAFSEEEPTGLSPIVQVVFNCVKASIDRDFNRYEQKSASGRKGGRTAKRPECLPEVSIPSILSVTEDKQGSSLPTEEKQTQAENNVLPSKKPSYTQSQSQSYTQTNFLFSSFPFSSPEEKEQKEKFEIISVLFFKNLPAPNQEYERMVAYNRLGDRKWDEMSLVQKYSAAQLWAPKQEQKPRFSKKFLQMWRSVVTGAAKLNPPPELIGDLLCDGLRPEVKGDALVLHCPERLSTFIERNLDNFLPIIRAYLNATNCKTLNYQKC